MTSFSILELSDPQAVRTISQAWYTREVQGEIATILQNGEKKASYPAWADAYISFDERLKDIHVADLRSILRNCFFASLGFDSYRRKNFWNRTKPRE